MRNADPEETFTSETTDDCDDDARTQLNRESAPGRTEGAEENIEQRGSRDEQERVQPRDAER